MKMKMALEDVATDSTLPSNVRGSGAGKVKTRKPRKWRKISDEPNRRAYTAIPADSVRSRIRDIIEGISENPDGNIHLVTGEFGTGKTVETARILIPKGTIWLAPQHDQLKTPEEVARENGTSYRRFPKIGPENCIDHSTVKKMLERGIRYRHVICAKCPERPRARVTGCLYLSGFHMSPNVESVLAVQRFHRSRGFYREHGNPKRRFLVFDEDPFDNLRPLQEITLSSIESYSDLLARAVASSNDRRRMPPGIVPPLPEMMGCPSDSVLENISIHQSVASAVAAGLRAGRLPMIPGELMARYRPESADLAHRFLHQLLQEDYQDKRHIRFYNCFQETDELLTGRARCLSISRKGLSFFIDIPFPPDKTVVILDATARPDIYRNFAGDREIVVHEVPRVAHNSRIFQYVDANFPRSGILQDFGVPLKGRGEKPRAYFTVSRLVRAIVERERPQHLGLIAHKKTVDLVRSQLSDDLDIVVGHFGALRGLNEFSDCDVLVIVGSPKRHPDDIRLAAMRIFGRPIPNEEMDYQDRRVSGANGTFGGEVRYYRSQEMREAYDWTVRNELEQAIGRSRYVQGGKRIYILTNEPLDGVPGITFLTKEDILGPRRPRVDSRYLMVENAVRRRLAKDESVSSKALATEFSGPNKMSRQTLSKHRTAAIKRLRTERQGNGCTSSSGTSSSGLS